MNNAGTFRKSTDALWSIINEFGARARANPDVVKASIRRFLDAENARHRAAAGGLDFASSEEVDAVFEVLTPEEVRADAFRAAGVYRWRMRASEHDSPSRDEVIAYLVRIHDLVVATGHDRAGRESRQPIAFTMDGLDEVRWSLLIAPEDLPTIRADLTEQGSHRASEYMDVVRGILPLPDEAGQQGGCSAPPQEAGQQSAEPPGPPPPAKGQPHQRWSCLYGMEEAAKAIGVLVGALRDHVKKYPSSHWKISRQKHRFDLNDGLFRDLEAPLND